MKKAIGWILLFLLANVFIVGCMLAVVSSPAVGGTPAIGLVLGGGLALFYDLFALGVWLVGGFE